MLHMKTVFIYPFKRFINAFALVTEVCSKLCEQSKPGTAAHGVDDFKPSVGILLFNGLCRCHCFPYGRRQPGAECKVQYRELGALKETFEVFFISVFGDE